MCDMSGWVLAQIACDMVIYLKVERESALFLCTYVHQRIFFWKMYLSLLEFQFHSFYFTFT